MLPHDGRRPGKNFSSIPDKPIIRDEDVAGLKSRPTPIAFYAPLKAPDHPTPSGDRQMGRLLLSALERAGFVPVASSGLRVHLPEGDRGLRGAQCAADAECERLLAAYSSGDLARPSLWFTYHPYYKSPDLMGPAIAKALRIPYVTAEASHARKRAAGKWARAHALNERGLRGADLHFCFTERDRAGLVELMGGEGKCARLAPFVDVCAIPARKNRRTRGEASVRLLTVAMMRPDVKLQSYRMLARTLCGMKDLNWTLDVVGDGEARPSVETAFAPLGRERIVWHGLLGAEDVGRLYARSDLFLWPGFGEAYGMAFLEAQAGGLAVVAQDVGGIASVVRHGRTGLLTPENDLEAFREAVRGLIMDRDRLTALGRAAAKFVRTERTVETAAATLENELGRLL